MELPGLRAAAWDDEGEPSLIGRLSGTALT
jgi:hypothetical protein